MNSLMMVKIITIYTSYIIKRHGFSFMKECVIRQLYFYESAIKCVSYRITGSSFKAWLAFIFVYAQRSMKCRNLGSSLSMGKNKCSTGGPC
jgi:hypothetical protein